MGRLRVAAADGTRELKLQAKLTVGRVKGAGAEGSELVLDDKGISRRHCEFEPTATGALVRDLGSSNGTLVNGEKVTERELKDGDTIRVGGIQIEYLASAADFALRFISGEHRGRELKLENERTTLGRRADNSLSFADVKVSGVHLEVVREGGGYVVRDLGSTNGTFLDGRKITEMALSHGDKVRLGESEFQFVDLRRGDVAIGGDTLERAAAAAVAVAPARRGKAAAIVGLVGVLAAVGGAGWYFFLRGGEGTAGGRKAPPAPAGTLLEEDWSFEDPAVVAGIWSTDLGDGFSARRGQAVSGNYAFTAAVDQGAIAASVRQPETIAKGAALTVRGQLAADDGVLASVALRFEKAATEESGRRLWTVVAARSHGGGFTAFDVPIQAPAWAEQVQLLVTARGSGSAAVDDLALLAEGGPIPGATPVGELKLEPCGAGTACLSHFGPLLEMFMPKGTHAAEGAPAIDLPPGAFAAEMAVEGASVRLKATPGPFAPDSFVAVIEPEIAPAGVTLLLATTSERRSGAFAATEVRGLLFGSAAERVEMTFSTPARVAAVERGEALELEVAPPAAGTLSVRFRASFEKERQEAGELLAAAQEDRRNGRLGAALAKLTDLRNRLPHDEKAFESARKLDAEITPLLESEWTAIDAEARSAEFLGSLERYRKVLKRAEGLLAQAEGLDIAAAIAQRVTGLRTTVATMEREQREEEARRLLALARAYASFTTGLGGKYPELDRTSTAGELLEQLQESYADTAAAKEARGDPAGGTGPERDREMNDVDGTNGGGS